VAKKNQPITPAEINERNRKYWSDPDHRWEAAMQSVIESHEDARKKGPRAGGAASAEASKVVAATTWHAECVTKARALLAQGRLPRELAGILANQFGKSTRQVNNVLKKAEVK
jgi:hypothetical protein